MMSGLVTLFVMFISFLLLPVRTLIKIGPEGRNKINRKDLFWLVVYSVTGILTMKAFALYLVAMRLI
ncbi:hypothetical protein QMM96_22240 [Citrobacter freundii]|uniref:hypothetical protein n=1 Tax=Citrobacter freundii TaxID=546 RepID=UPI002B2527A8|nr:hypothetical protein [Citrobacter freundii]MEB2478152.1 hypothetical protein [Citrobacter freundii]